MAEVISSSINETPDLMKTLVEENDALKAILQGATLTVTIGESHKKQLLVNQLLKPTSKSDNTRHFVGEGINRSDLIGSSGSHGNKLHSVTSTIPAEETKKRSEQPVFYKKDFLSVLEEKNQWKEKADQLEEELEEWKRAALEAQEKVEKLEAEISEVQQRIGGFYHPNEVQADILGLLPKGPNFRPQPLAEVSEIYVTDVEVSRCVQQEKKSLFAIQLTWSDKRQFEVYRRYGEFFTLQHTLLLLYPEESGKRRSSERIIPSLPTADNILAIFGATNSKTTLESRLQLIHSYCHTILLQLPKKISRSPLLFDFFKARPSDKQLESLKRPLTHSLEMSVYPLIPDGKSQGLYVAIASYDFSSETNKSNKVSLEVRETVRVVKQDDPGWWYVQKVESGECGFVPASYIKKVGDPDIPDAPIDMTVLGFATSVVLKDDTDQATPTPSSVRDGNINPDLNYTTICEYDTTDSRQLSFPEDAVITIIDKSEDGWWFGMYEGREGWVPSTYLEPCSAANNEDSENQIEIGGQEYVTTMSYTAKDVDEVSLPSGVKVEVLEKSFTGWWKVKYRKRLGYVPATMLKMATPVSLDDSEEQLSPTSNFLHSISGMKKPPPRRKFVTGKKRAQTFMVPIEEKEETPLTATTCSPVPHEDINTRRLSFKNFLRRSTADSKTKLKINANEDLKQRQSFS